MPDTVTVAHVTTKWFPSDDLGRIYSGTCRECGARVTLDGSRYSTWDAPEAPRLTPAECPPPGHQRPFQY